MRSAPQICDDSVVTHLNKGRIREKAACASTLGARHNLEGRDEVKDEQKEEKVQNAIVEGLKLCEEF